MEYQTQDPRTIISRKKIYKIGGYAAIAMLFIMIAQIVIFILWPPPTSIESFFHLFQENWLLGLLSMDLLYILNNSLLIFIYLAFYWSLNKTNQNAMIIGTLFGLIGIAAYFSSNTAFEMLSLSHQYAAAANAQKSTFIGAGQALMAIYKGTAFNVYYVFNALTLLIISLVMFKSDIYNKTIASWGLCAGIFMTIPSTAGNFGLIFSLISLIPWAVFLLLSLKKFFFFSRS